MTRALSVALVTACVLVSLAPSDVMAARPEEAPEASRAQVESARRALAPFFTGKQRRLQAGAPGSIEAALAAYAPARFHPVAEGALPEPRAGTHCPDDMALVQDRFCVDKWEASLDEVAADGTATPHAAHARLETGHVYIARSRADVYPQAYVSAREARAACTRAQKRLCEPVEWRAACGGSEGTAFPYGGQRRANACHDTGVAPMLVLYPEQAKRGAFGVPEMNDPRLNQLPNTLAKTGAYADCKNDFGVYDMVGNLHEWTADTNGTFQGGFWLDTAQHGDGCAYRTIAHDFDYHDYSTGFRCCADPQ
jgi:hypothetical protein